MDIQEFYSKYNYHSSTPMMQQYLDMKFAHINSLLLFRMGDFYELFYDDAILCSQILGIALSKRGKVESLDIPMCGVPYHAINLYLPRLVKNGHNVAICEQLENPEDAKKARGNKAVVKREVVRIITPGTLLDENLLNKKVPNYLSSIVFEKDKCHISYIDLSTFDFYITNVSLDNLISELDKIDPKEIIISEDIGHKVKDIISPYKARLVYQVPSYFSYLKSNRIIKEFYNILTVDSLGSFSKFQISCIGAILEYIRLTQKSLVSHLNFPIIVSKDNFMIIDSATRRNLELLYDTDHSKKRSLFGVLDNMLTSIGSRTLYNFILNPLNNSRYINQRLDAVKLLYNNLDIVNKVRKLLSSFTDIERVISRISRNVSSSFDLFQLSSTLKIVDNIKSLLHYNFSSSKVVIIDIIMNQLISMEELILKIDDVIIPNNDNLSSMINPNCHPKLKELTSLIDNIERSIESLQRKYRMKTGIDNLKILSNNMLGFFVEVKSRFADKLNSSDFIHRQTLSSVIRYSTEDLYDLENKINNANNLKASLEEEIFQTLCQDVLKCSSKIKSICKHIGLLDVFCGFAVTARENNYICPIVTEDVDFIVKGARHPIIEKFLFNDNVFVSNDCDLNYANRLWLITAPNMSGKSTFLRQNALLVVMSHIGCFVPATKFEIGRVDKLFSRIGASDDLSKGNSTFMVEMLEASRILSQSTKNSFIILDELGRGTSTFDGVAIAWACLEHIHNKLKSRCLFATHYYELVNSCKALDAMCNYTIRIDESADSIFSLYKIVPGYTNKSYGIEVAKLAGLPKVVIKRASEILNVLEDDDHNKKENKLSSDLQKASDNSDKVFKAKYFELKKLLEELDLNSTSPKDALDFVYHLVEKLKTDNK